MLYGCAPSHTIEIYKIDYDGVHSEAKGKEYAENAINHLFKFNLLPSDADTIIVIEDHNDELMLQCNDYAFFWNNKKKHYRLCGSPSEVSVDTLKSFYNYKNELLNLIKERNYEGIKKAIDQSQKYDDTFLTIYRFNKIENSIEVDVLNVLNADYFRVNPYLQ